MGTKLIRQYGFALLGVQEDIFKLEVQDAPHHRRNTFSYDNSACLNRPRRRHMPAAIVTRRHQ
jgi:hypothetical protein